jgi:hypothetical protein
LQCFILSEVSVQMPDHVETCIGFLHLVVQVPR